MPNTVHDETSLHDTLSDNTEMLNVMLGNIERLYRFLFGSTNVDAADVCRDKPCDCVMAEIDHQQIFLKRCLDILQNTLNKLGC